MNMKVMYVNFIVSFFCSLNCTYCTLTKEQRAQRDVLSDTKFRLYLIQLVNFYKKNNYDQLVISITGDELHGIPNFLEHLKLYLQEIETRCEGIPKENIKLKMHTNLKATKEFYTEQFAMLEDAKRYCTPEFETVYQAMYHTPETESMLYFIQDAIGDIDFVSNIALRNENDRQTVEHLPCDTMYDFSLQPKREKFTDKEVLFINVVKSNHIRSGCGHEFPSNLLTLKDKKWCSECPNSSCKMLEDINRI